MNIHFSQVERKSQVVSYLLAAFAVFTAFMLTLSLIRDAEFHWFVPSTAVQAVQTIGNDLPIAIPAPLPPAEEAPAIATPEPVGSSPSILVPQVIAAPMPSVP